MKTIYKIILPVLFIGLASSCGTTGKNSGYNEDSTGLAGDNFSLPGALELFKESKDLAEFEQKLNSNAKVNNLDLNNDGKVDYIKVLDLRDDAAHAVVLQVPVAAAGTNQFQDVAVIELEKKNDMMQLQIIGDEDIYGRTYYVQPKDNTLKIVNTTPSAVPATTTVSTPLLSVNGWPIISSLFTAPTVAAYSSPWTPTAVPSYYVVRDPQPVMTFADNNKVRGFTVVETSERAPLAFKLYSPTRQSSMFVVDRYREPLKVYRARLAERDKDGKDKKVKIKDGDHNDDGHPDRGNEKADKDKKDKKNKKDKDKDHDDDDDDDDDDRDDRDDRNDNDRDDHKEGKGYYKK